MNPKTTLVMGVIFVAVFATVAILKIVQAPTDKQKAEWQEKVVEDLQDVDVENLTQASLTRDKEQLEFNYVESGDRWQMVKPLDVLAQTSAVRDLFFDLKNLKRRTTSGSKDAKIEGLVAPKTSADLVQYGLDSPASTITLTFKPKGSESATKSVTLQIGAATADKDGLYVKLANDKYVSVVNKSNLRSLEKKTSEFRQQKLVTVSRFDSDMIRLQWPDRVIGAEKKDAKWQLVDPVTDRADSNKLEELIGKLGDLKADGDADYIDDDAKDLAKYGLDTPQLIAEIRKPGSKPKADDKKDKSKTKEKPAIVEKVLIGKPVEGRDDKVYAMLSDQKYVVAVAANIVNELSKQPNELRSHDLIELTQSDVDYVRVQRAGAEIALAKKDRDWEIVQPKTLKAEQSAVTELVRKIDELDIKEFIDDAEAAAYGLDQPALSVAIWQKGLKDDKSDTAKKEDNKAEEASSSNEPKGEPIRVSFGKVDDEKKLVYVRRGDEATVFAVASEGVMDIVDRNYLAYRNKLVLNFGQMDVAKFSVRRDGKTFSVERKKLKEDDIQETWRMLEPVDAPADSNTITRALGGFARLNAQKFVTEEETDLKNYGLDEPGIRATASLKKTGDKDPEQHVLLIGNEAEDGGYYAKLGSDQLIFSVDRLLVDDLNSELRDHTVLKFDGAKADGMTLTWADGKKLELVNKKPEGGTAKAWSVSGDEDLKLDTRKATDLTNLLALLSTDRYAQYDGEFTEAHGLLQPVLQIEVKVEGESSPKVLRIGSAEGDKRFVATGDKSGPVALIPEDRFKDLLGGPAYFAQSEAKKSEPDTPEPAKDDESKKDDAKPDTTDEKKSDETKTSEKKVEQEKAKQDSTDENKTDQKKSDSETDENKEKN